MRGIERAGHDGGDGTWTVVRLGRTKPKTLQRNALTVESRLAVLSPGDAVPAEPGIVIRIREILAEELFATFGAVEGRLIDEKRALSEIARFMQFDQIVNVCGSRVVN